MTYYMAVAFGGALGAVSRFWLMSILGNTGERFPWGTLTVNVLGSLLIGILFVALIERAGPDGHWRALLIVGYLGAFTTFSTFSLDALVLLQQGQFAQALAYMAGSVVLCLAAAGLGIAVARGAF